MDQSLKVGYCSAIAEVFEKAWFEVSRGESTPEIAAIQIHQEVEKIEHLYKIDVSYC